MKKIFPVSRKSDSQRSFSISLLLKGIVFAFLFSLLCFLILSIILSFTSISESIIKPASYIVMIVSIVIASGYVAQRVNKKGWIHGGVTGLLYILVLTIIGYFTGGGFIFDQLLISRILLGIVAGSIGGILGINLK